LSAYGTAAPLKAAARLCYPTALTIHSVMTYRSYVLSADQAQFASARERVEFSRTLLACVDGRRYPERGRSCRLLPWQLRHWNQVTVSTCRPDRGAGEMDAYLLLLSFGAARRISLNRSTKRTRMLAALARRIGSVVSSKTA